MRVSRVNFKPSLLSYAIAAAAVGLSQQAVAVDLCVDQTTITISGAATDDTCSVNQAAASVTVPLGQTFSDSIAVYAPGVSVTNVGTINNGSSTEETDFSVAAQLYAAGVVKYTGDEMTSLVNNGTLRATVAGTLHATGGAYSSTSSYTSSSSADARGWGVARAVDLNGMGAAQISNTGTIEAIADFDITADYDTAYGEIYADALRVSGLQEGAINNAGTLRAVASLEADYGTAEARGLAIEGPATGDVTNSGRISATATTYSDGVAVRAAGVFMLGLDNADFLNTGTIEATASGEGGGIRKRGPGGNAEAIGVYIGYDSSSSSSYLRTGDPYAGLSGGASFTNSGRITASIGDEGLSGDVTGVGIGQLNGSTFSNTAAGVIQAVIGDQAYGGEATGLAIDGIWNDATASNAGLISAQVEDALSGGYAQGVYVDDLGSFGQFENSGVISASVNAGYYAGARGVSIDRVYAGEFINANTGDITATAQVRANYADAVGVAASYVSGDSVLVNEGRISAKAGVQTSGNARATGIQIWNLDGGLINRGTVSASQVMPDLPVREEGIPMVMDDGVAAYETAIYVGSGYGSVTNEEGGVLEGAVQLYLSDSSSSAMPLMAVSELAPVALSNSGRIVLPATTGSFVYGGYRQHATGELELKLRDTGNYATFSADEADFTDGNRVVISVDPLGQIVDGDSFSNVIVADSLTTPDGFDVTDTSLFWDFETEETSTSLSLVARYLGIGEVLGDKGNGLTKEQVAFAEDLLLGNLGPEFASIVDALNRAPDANAALDVLESVGPALSGAQGFSARGASKGALNAISSRLNELRNDSSGDAFQKNAVWIKPFLGMAEQDSVNGIDGYDVNTAGFILGVDGDLTDSWRVGVGVASSMTDVEGDKADLDVESIQLALYASYAINDTAAIDLDINHVSNSFDSTRRIPAASSTALASYDGRQVTIGVGVSNRLAMGEKASFVPSAQVRYNRFMLDGYTETGAGAFNLAVTQQTETSLQWLAKAGFEFSAGPGTLSTSIGAGYDTLDAAVTTASFAGGGPLYVSNGIKPESTVLTGGLGYRYVTAKSLEITADYDLESRGSEFLAQTLSVKFRLPF